MYEAHADQVARWVFRLYGPRGPDSIEDVVQDVFVQIAKKLESFRGEAELTTWMFAITRNIVAKRIRREQRRRAVFGAFGAWTQSDRSTAAGDSVAQISDFIHGQAHPDPDTAYETAQDVHCLYAAMDKLPEKYRTVIALCELDNMSTEAVADLLDISPNAVWVRLSRARKQLAVTMAQITKNQSTNTSASPSPDARLAGVHPTSTSLTGEREIAP